MLVNISQCRPLIWKMFNLTSPRPGPQPETSSKVRIKSVKLLESRNVCQCSRQKEESFQILVGAVITWPCRSSVHVTCIASNTATTLNKTKRTAAAYSHDWRFWMHRWGIQWNVITSGPRKSTRPQSAVEQWYKLSPIGLDFRRWSQSSVSQTMLRVCPRDVNSCSVKKSRKPKKIIDFLFN